MIDQAGILMAQGLGIASERIQGVNDNMSQSHYHEYYEIYYLEAGERVFTFLPKFELYEGPQYIGCISKEISFLKPSYNIDFNGWEIRGSFMEWDYTITGAGGREIAVISKELFHMTDTYVLDIADPENALYVLMFVLAIDAEKCSRND